MNILTDKFPTALEVGGKVYPIATDFRDCLRIILAFEDGELANLEKQVILLRILYKENIPANVSEAVKQAVKFLNGGKEQSGDDELRPRLYSFDKDAGFIFAGFRSTHNIDLEKENMHWWKFLALFMDLDSECTFCSLVNLRKRVKNGEASKEERKLAQEMGEVFDVSETNDMTLEEMEIEQAFMNSLMKGSV